MQKFISELVGTALVTKKERLLLGHLYDIAIQPDTGKIVGFIFTTGKENTLFCANYSDVVGYGDDFIMIESVEKVAPLDDIIRIKEVLDLGIKLVGSLVVDDTGMNIGNISNYTLDLTAGRLARIYVKPKSFLQSFTSEIIINEKNILKIEKDKVTVRSGLTKKKSPDKERFLRSKTPKTELA